jgi:hypothetical protein
MTLYYMWSSVLKLTKIAKEKKGWMYMKKGVRGDRLRNINFKLKHDQYPSFVCNDTRYVKFVRNK